jgi:uncharacterized protein with PIN domain
MDAKFLGDAMLGKLVRYLRILGFDTSYLKNTSKEKLLLESRRDHRIILTRDRKMTGMPEVLIVDSEDADEQLRQVTRALKLAPKGRYFCRCIVCNTSLVPINKLEIAGLVPYYTYKHFDNFSVCPACRRVYWAGSHHANMKKKIEEMLGTASPSKRRRRTVKSKRDEKPSG